MDIYSVDFCDDLEFFPHSYCSNEEFILWGSLKQDKYIKLPLSWQNLVSQLVEINRNSKSYDTLAEFIKNNYQDFKLDGFLELLYHKKLATLKATASNALLSPNSTLAIDKDEFRRNTKTLLEIKISGILKPEPAALLVKLFFPVIASVLFANIGSLIIIYIKEVNIWNYPNAMLHQASLSILLAFLIAIICHEVGHIICANSYGIRLRSVKFRNYLIFQNYISVQLPGTHTLNKKDKSRVSMAGPLVNLLLGGIGSLIYFIGLLTNTQFQFALNLAFINILFCFINLNPFYETDGYHFISSNIFRSQDIKSDSLNMLRTHKKLLLVNKIFISLFFISRLVICGISIRAGFFLANWLAYTIELPSPHKLGIALVLSFLLVFLQVKQILSFFGGLKGESI